jgi:hypothetical protein
LRHLFLLAELAQACTNHHGFTRFNCVFR